MWVELDGFLLLCEVYIYQGKPVFPSQQGPTFHFIWFDFMSMPSYCKRLHQVLRAHDVHFE